MGTSWGRLWDQVAERPREQMMGRSGDVPGTSVIQVYIQVRSIFNLLSQVTPDFIVNCSSKKFDLRACGKVPFQIF